MPITRGFIKTTLPEGTFEFSTAFTFCQGLHFVKKSFISTACEHNAKRAVSTTSAFYHGHFQTLSKGGALFVQLFVQQLLPVGVTLCFFSKSALFSTAFGFFARGFVKIQSWFKKTFFFSTSFAFCPGLYKKKQLVQWSFIIERSLSFF